MKDKVRDKLQQGKGKSLERSIKELNSFFKGWINYFKLTEVTTILEELDQWIRRKLRRIIWKQLKNPRMRGKVLEKQGVGQEEAWNTAGSHKGVWRNSRTKAMHIAYPNSYFEGMGLVSLLQEKLCL